MTDTPHYTTPRSNGMAVAALITSIIALVTSIFVIGGLIGVVGVVLAIVGLRWARRIDGKGRHGGMAITALILSVLSIVISAAVWVTMSQLVKNSGAQDCIANAHSSSEAADCMR